jgi:hypothetical protein
MKKLLVMLLIGVMLLSSMVYAVEIKDVEEDHWAYTYVKQAQENQVMPLYGDGNFYPLEKATKMEVINVIYRMALTKEETSVEAVDGYLKEYKETIDGLLIPQSLEPYGADNHRAIAYALKRGIVRTSELSLFFTAGRFEPISKADASVFMAKALNVYLDENVNKFYEIRYKDGGEITLMAWPYINLLIEKEIVSEEGDNGYFYPNSALNRSILSVLASRVLTAIDGFEKQTETEENVAENTTSSSGRLSIIHYNENIIEVRDSFENLKIYDASSASFKLNGLNVGLENLEPGMEVKIQASANKLVSLSVQEEYNTFESTLSDVGVWLTIKDETYTVVFFGKDGAFPYLKALKSVVVTRDYQTSSLDEIQEGDRVVVSYEGNYVRKIDSFSNKVVLEGVLQRASAFNKDDVVRIKLSNDYMFEQVVDSNIQKINVNESLIKGDVVRLTLEKGKITGIEGTGLTTEATGRITQIIIGDSPSITLMNSSGINKTYKLQKNLVVKKLEATDPLGIYALRLDQNVTINLSGVLVEKININKAVERTEFEAEITEIHTKINILKAIDESGKEWIISLEGSDQVIGDYQVGDSIYVYGVALSSDLFEADLVIILD